MQNLWRPIDDNYRWYVNDDDFIRLLCFIQIEIDKVIE